MQCHCSSFHFLLGFVSIPQAVWIACNLTGFIVTRDSRSFNTASGMDCMQCTTNSNAPSSHGSFNTASGMDCMQYQRLPFGKSSLMFQYRKRYGLHAISIAIWQSTPTRVSIPQAVWIACNQTWAMVGIFPLTVSIPQAVWIACNSNPMAFEVGKVYPKFQYRKRYGLHAILSPRTLENSEPRNRFSNTEPSKRQVQRTQVIGQRLVCENVPRTRAKGEARLADVDRSSLPFCAFPQTSGNFFVAKSGSKGV